ncbi:AimR family lysis-lysogeny pheromone receptor [Bacillus horti]|uniref:Transcriptional regulator with XRE-family HTH domain n=1 Tax=Caldalkalibacillus horti TaxID=77523 RepID=A0ABT9VU25_9BACI|nr:AimR family lysis-lysogeny pheromone receptor [Bacillus horti]MDQ0164486.1 transcriptional regulator with XRE-family HTH domain [Bacillus horti]
MLQHHILQALNKKKGINQKRLAQVARTNESSISRFLHDFEELNFEGILRIVQFLFPSQEHDMLRLIIPKFRSRNARHALDYSIMHRLDQEAEHLITVLKSSTNPVDKEWATIYTLIHKRNLNSLPLLEQLKQIEIFHPREPDMKVLKMVLHAYICFDLHLYPFLSLHSFEVDEKLKQLKSTFMRQSLNVRYSLLMGYYSLNMNDITKARWYYSSILDQAFFKHMLPTVYFYLGQSYLYEDYEQAYYLMSYAAHAFAEAGREDLYHTSQLMLSFLQSYWRVDRDFPFELVSYAEELEYIYYLIQLDQKEQAKSFLTKLDIHHVPSHSKGFVYFYLGLLYGDKEFFYHSVEWFRLTGNYFYCQLPLRELRKMQENRVILRVLSTVRRERLCERNGFGLVTLSSKNPLGVSKG